MSEEEIITKDIDWLKEPTYRQIITKEKLLKDIKTNIINLLDDYRGRGINNEDRLTEEVNKMFTGGVVPSLIDWKVLNMVLYELSEIKEQGEMYKHFIRDVSDSLGVNDLKKIRNFIEYITTLPPMNPKVSFTVDKYKNHEIKNLTADIKMTSHSYTTKSSPKTKFVETEEMRFIRTFRYSNAWEKKPKYYPEYDGYHVPSWQHWSLIPDISKLEYNKDGYRGTLNSNAYKYGSWKKDEVVETYDVGPPPPPTNDAYVYPVYKKESAHTIYEGYVTKPGDTIYHSYNQANARLSWKLGEPKETPNIRINIEDSKSEDVLRYTIDINSGDYNKSIVISAKDFDKNAEISDNLEIKNRVAYIKIPLVPKQMFTNENIRNKISIEIHTQDKRGNISIYKEEKFVDEKDIKPVGFEKYALYYKPSENKPWERIASEIDGTNKNYGPIILNSKSGNHQYAIVGVSKLLISSDNPNGYTEKVYSPRYNVNFSTSSITQITPPIAPPQKLSRYVEFEVNYNLVLTMIMRWEHRPSDGEFENAPGTYPPGHKWSKPMWDIYTEIPAWNKMKTKEHEEDGYTGILRGSQIKNDVHLKNKVIYKQSLPPASFDIPENEKRITEIKSMYVVYYGYITKEPRIYL